MNYSQLILEAITDPEGINVMKLFALTDQVEVLIAELRYVIDNVYNEALYQEGEPLADAVIEHCKGVAA